MKVFLGINLSIFTSYLLPIAFLPDLAVNNDISGITTGIILSLFPLGAVVSSVIMGRVMGNLGKLLMIKMFSVVLSVAMLIFGLAM